MIRCRRCRRKAPSRFLAELAGWENEKDGPLCPRCQEAVYAPALLDRYVCRVQPVSAPRFDGSPRMARVTVRRAK